MPPPNTFKQKNFFAVFSPIFQVQAAIGSPLASAALTARLPLPRDNKPMPTRRVTRDETRDCTGKYLVGRRLTSRLALWTIQLDATAQLATGFLALAFGKAGAPGGAGPHTHAITRSPQDQLSATSFIIGAEDSDEPAELYSDMVLNTLDIEAQVRQKVIIRASFVGSANVVDVPGFTPPACGAAPVPVYANDCAVIIGGTDFTSALRTFAYSYNNNLAANEDPFPFDAVDPVRIERGDEVSQFRFGVYGTRNSALYAAAAAETVEAIDLRVGTATEGAHIISDGAQLILADQDITYATEASRSVINLLADPFSVGGALPDHVAATLAQADRFLTVPA